MVSDDLWKLLMFAGTGMKLVGLMFGFRINGSQLVLEIGFHISL